MSDKKSERFTTLKTIGLLLFVIVLIGAYPCYKGYEWRKWTSYYNENIKEMRAQLDAFNKETEKNVSGKTTTFPYGDMADIAVNAYMKTRNGHVEVTYWAQVTLHATEAFDNLTAARQKEYLEWGYNEYGRRLEEAYDTVMDRSGTNPAGNIKSAVNEGHLDDEYSIYLKNIYTFYIETPSNTYKSCQIENYFLKNGKDVFVRTTTPTPTPTPRTDAHEYRPSTVWNDYDYYDVDEYDDPEDFWYDYEDDFDDYEDAEDYWEEHHK